MPVLAQDSPKPNPAAVFLDGLVSDLNSQGLSPVSVDDIARVTTDYFSPESSDPWTLKDHLNFMPPASPAWMEPLTEKIIDKMMAFIRYYVREIVAKNRSTDFQAVAEHDFHRLVIMFLKVMSQKHPLMIEDLHSPANAQRLKLRNFIADVIPALLVTYKSIEPSGRNNFVVLAFYFVKTFQFLSTPRACRDTLNSNFFRPFEQSPTTNDAFASAFILLINLYRDTMLSLNSRQLESTNLSIVFAYNFILPLLERDSSCIVLLKAGFFRTSCELFSAILAAMHLYAVDGVPGPKQKGIIISSGDALCSISRCLSERMHLEGHVRIELFYEFDHPYQLREFDRARRSVPQEAAFGSTFEEDQLEYMTIYVDCLKPYLVYHDILEKAAKRFLGQPECAGDSPVWKSFVSEIERLEKSRIIFAESYLSSAECDVLLTAAVLKQRCRSPVVRAVNSFNTVKKERSKTGRLTGLPSRRDVYFMNGIACMTLARHAPFARNAVPVGLVRHKDFTQSPPKLTLRPLVDPIYNENTRIVIGEDEAPGSVLYEGDVGSGGSVLSKIPAWKFV
ncbi:hypothetical protein CPB85DRAFT_1559538 [Mucidula mucida]|nr:hypothetical protein CPB85DRAFT_1559538 [Mucidula mucida]